MQIKAILSSTKIIMIAVILMIIAGTGGFLYYNSRGGRTTQYGGLLEYVSVDKMFTSFAYVPLVDYQRDYLKRDMVVLESWRAGKVIQGLCFRQYEVGIGYDNVAEYFTKYMDVACNGEYQKLPKPTILSTNAIKSDIHGDYSRKKCDTWDLDVAGKRNSRQYIIDQLKDDGKWNSIVENSQKILCSFIKINCE
jgi:hypothetical protein